MSSPSVLLCVILLLWVSECFSQGPVENYLSVQGTWAKIKDPARARFGGNNQLLRRHFEDQYFSKYYSAFIELAGRENITINVTGQLAFMVRKNDVDSVRFIQSSGFSSVDSVMALMVRSTSGKWMPGKIDGNVVTETINVWIHIFSGDTKGKTRGVRIQEANQYFLAGEYKKAVKEYDAVLHYDELDLRAVTQKGLALVKMGKSAEACLLWNVFQKYETVEIQVLLKENCEHKNTVTDDPQHN